ncbi:carboxy terminal-processing peptidase [Noviherbaspirillum pedocola]|uniref:Carboxy terminal-processing peptidase n=1 Tax=Noviherbaspirillum pedocola TaxID=2801341 RepID=A0A934W9D8_9BURK|nr:carboxy terminal-processing peptidase [Noviherbaspirillum pedocola]MBK4737968.1 carboxy terminal-processing peptidase [Noviherbaspirillum pedocola]
MKKRLVSILLALVTAATTASAAPATPSNPVLLPQPQQMQAAALSAQILSRYHYRAMPLDDAMSAKIFDRYLKSLDPEKLFFTQLDIDQMAPARTQLDDSIKRGDFHHPYSIFGLYQQRLAERIGYARELLNQKFDFTKNESYSYRRDKDTPWAASEDEIRDLWRKRIKGDWLRLKLAGKDDKFIRTTLDKRYANLLSRMQLSKSEDVFQIFMDAYATSFDPHTNYMGPRETADFDIAMRLSLVGIGAVLQEREDYITIRELVPGGPAALSGKLNVGDRIVGVAQGATGDMKEVVGWRVDDAVKLIRGTKDTMVRLDLLPAGAGPEAKPREVRLVRDNIKLEERAAKKSVIESKDGAVTRRVGVITLPMFYQDTEARRRGDKNYRSAARDVARLLDEMKSDKVDAVVVDLRNNGGGSLDEAIGVTSLFTGAGPVVQQRNSKGEVAVNKGNDAKPAWDGPLGVLINRGSASASEIFAAAIQDYGRGVIIGEPSFGKGTVQTVVNLDEMTHSDKHALGELKMTIAQFFRINGGTTQLRGVTPDIAMPQLSDPNDFGESSFDNALPWSEIKPADYAPISDLAALLPELRTRHAARLEASADFRYLDEELAELKALRDKRQVSLNEAQRRAEEKAMTAKLAPLLARANKGDKPATSKQAADVALALVPGDAALRASERKLTDELAEEKARKNARDLWLEEAARVVSDESALQQATARKSVARN